MGVSKVALRRRPITGARESLYLDFYPAICNRTHFLYFLSGANTKK